MTSRRCLVAALCLWTLLTPPSFADKPKPVAIGSKSFTESVILGDILEKLLQARGIPAQHKAALGGTRVLWSALKRGDIDMYVDYTGTLIYEVFAKHKFTTFEEVTTKLAEVGIRTGQRIGFNNTYALGMTKGRANQLGINDTTDLVHHPDLVFGFSNEFVDRQDGWRKLQRTYRLPQKNVRGIDHDLSYRGLVSGSTDVTVVYTTDAEIAHHDLKTLTDSKRVFPDYYAVVLYRADLLEKRPELSAVVAALDGRINEPSMIAMNDAVKFGGQTEKAVAGKFLTETFSLEEQQQRNTMWSDLWGYTKTHLFLVVVSLGAAILLAIPLGIIATRLPKFGQVILGVVGIIQTIPSLALLVFMIPLFGIGEIPAIIALFLYSLLPIVRNTYTGITGIPAPLVETSIAIGLTPGQRLRYVEIPLALPSILAGIKTSAILNIGVATIGALIGAGGFGQPILTGIRLDNTFLILLGAIPAALMAIAVQALFEIGERFVVSKGLTLKN